MGVSSQRQKNGWTYFAFEFLTVFAGVTIAFLLNTWNENQRDTRTETKILTEIRNGLQLDTGDIRVNINGHQWGIEACWYFRSLAYGTPVADSLAEKNFTLLLRDFISIQNKSGYESLKSKGLELVSDDSLRLEIIGMYDYYFQVIEKLEEHYVENQFYETYFYVLSDLLSPHMDFDEKGHLVGFRQPIPLTAIERNRLLLYLAKIEFNREFIIMNYREVEKNACDLISRIDEELKHR